MSARAAGVVLLATLLAGCSGTSAPPASQEPLRRAPQTAPARTGPEVAAPAGTQGCPTTTPTAPVTGGLPELTLGCLTGPGAVSLTGLSAGTPTVLNVWASWCAPCVEEMPLLEQAHVGYGERVRVLGVLTRDPTDGWADILTETGARYPSVRDDAGAVLAWTGSPGPPVTVFVRADGTVAFRKIGAVRDLAALQALVLEHLGVAS